MSTSSPSVHDVIDHDYSDAAASEAGAASPSSSAATAPFDLASLVAGGGNAELQALAADPQALLQRWMEQRRAAAEEEAARASTTQDEDLELQRLDQLRAEEDRRERQARFRELRQLMHQMYLEIEQLRARNDKLAAALGACHLCFGDDLSCPECTGRGRPGGAMPDRVLFAALVTPAVRRLSEPNRYRPDRGPRLGDLSPQRFPMEEEAPPNVFD